jgi:transcription elongation factor GreA
MAELSAEGLSLQEAASHYLASLSPDLRQQSQAEVHRFARWYGADRPVGELRGHDVSAYADTLGAGVADAPQRIDTVRSFLAFAKKKGFTPTNLAVHLRVRKVASGQPSAGPGRPVREVSLTEEGRAELQAELERLKAERPRVAEELQRAMSDRDVSENAPLDAIREQQAYLESRIRDAEDVLRDAVSVEERKPQGALAGVGSTLVLSNLKSGGEVRYTLVSPSEVNPGQGRISVESPVGKALLKRRAGDEVEVAAPAGVVRFRIERIEG